MFRIVWPVTKQLDTLLDPYRDAAANRDAAAITGDEGAIKICSAWNKIPVQWKKAAGKAPANVTACWLWLWEGCSYDLKKLAAAAQLSERKTLKALRACVIARLLYPDGTISTAAEHAIDTRPTKRAPGRPPKEKT